jgi:hypothetical protein
MVYVSTPLRNISTTASSDEKFESYPNVGTSKSKGISSGPTQTDNARPSISEQTKESA